MNSNFNQDPGESPRQIVSGSSSTFPSSQLVHKRKRSNEDPSTHLEAPPKKLKGKEKNETVAFPTEPETSNRTPEPNAGKKPKRGRPPKIQNALPSQSLNSRKKPRVFEKYNLKAPISNGIASSSNSQPTPSGSANLPIIPFGPPDSKPQLAATSAVSQHFQGQVSGSIAIPPPPLAQLQGPVTVQQARHGRQLYDSQRYPESTVHPPLFSDHGGTGAVPTNLSSFSISRQGQLNVAGLSVQVPQRASSQLLPQGVATGGQFSHNHSMMHDAISHGSAPMNRAGHDDYASGLVPGVPTTTGQTRPITPGTYQLRNNLMPPSAPRMSRSSSDSVSGVYAPIPQQPPITRRPPSGLGNAINMPSQQGHYAQPYPQAPATYVAGPERRHNQSCPPPDQGHVPQHLMGYVAPMNRGVEFPQHYPQFLTNLLGHLPSMENLDYSQHVYPSSTGMPCNSPQLHITMNYPPAPSNVPWTTSTGASGSQGYHTPVMQPETGLVETQYHPSDHHQLPAYESFSQQEPAHMLPPAAIQAPIAHLHPLVEEHRQEFGNQATNHYHRGSLRHEYTGTVHPSTSQPLVEDYRQLHGGLEMPVSDIVNLDNFNPQYVESTPPFDISDTNAVAVDRTLSLPVPELKPLVEKQEEPVKTAHEEEKEAHVQRAQEPAATVQVDDKVEPEPVGSLAYIESFDEAEPTDLDRELFGDLGQDDEEEAEETEVSEVVLAREVTSESLSESVQVLPAEVISAGPQTGRSAATAIVIEDGDGAEDTARAKILAEVARADSPKFDDWLLHDMMNEAADHPSSDDWLLRDLQKEENNEVKAADKEDEGVVVEGAQVTSNKYGEGAMKLTEEHDVEAEADVDWLAEAMAHPSSPVGPVHKPEIEPEQKIDAECLYPPRSPTTSKRNESDATSASTAVDLGGRASDEAPFLPSQFVEDYDHLYDSDFSSSDDSLSS